MSQTGWGGPLVLDGPNDVLPKLAVACIGGISVETCCSSVVEMCAGNTVPL